MKEKIELYKMRTFTELLSDTFSFVRQNFKPLFKGLFFIALPALLLSAIAGIFFWGNYLKIFISEMMNGYGNVSVKMFGGMIVMYLSMIIAITLIMNTTYSYIKLYREDKEREITVSILWQESKKYFWKVIGALFIIFFTVIAVMLVFSLLVVALNGVSKVLLVLLVFFMVVLFLFFGVFFGIKFTFFPFFIVVGDSNIMDSFSGSYNFTRGIFWKTFGFVIIISFIVGTAMYIFQIPSYITMFIGAITGFTNGMGSASFIMLLSSVFMSVGMACGYLLYSIMFVGQSIFYFSEIEKEQGVMANKEIDEIGKRDD